MVCYLCGIKYNVASELVFSVILVSGVHVIDITFLLSWSCILCR